MPAWRKKKKWDSLRKFFADNPGYSKEYYDSHKPEANARAMKRKLNVKLAIHAGSNKPAIDKIYKDCFELSKKTGIKHNVDHVIPIEFGGWHHELNLQILPEKINKSKKDNPLWEMADYKCWRDIPKFLWPDEMLPIYEKIQQVA